MQIFRPFPSHKQSAMYLCDLRLNKQVLECSQIIELILYKLNLTQNEKKGHWNHPITQHIWNNGKPCLPDLYRYMNACNKEWIRRGRNRGVEFQAKLDTFKRIIQCNRDMFNWDQMSPFFCYGDIRCYDEGKVFTKYRKLLKDKWMNDKCIVKSSVKINVDIQM